MFHRSGQGRDRTADTRIFSPVLYLLSYLSQIELNCRMCFAKHPSRVPEISRWELAHGRNRWRQSPDASAFRLFCPGQP